MRSPPEGFDESALANAIVRHWKIDVDSLSYEAVGGGSHHWLLRSAESGYRFVTVDDLGTKPWLGSDDDTAFAGLGAAYATARRLHDSGLEFVVAPIATSSGSMTERLDEGFSVALFPYIAGRPGTFGEPFGARDTSELCRLWARLHQVRDSAPKRSLEVPGRSNLESALASLGQIWSGGPYSEAARDWLVRNRELVASALSRYDRLAASVATRERVITHGEPHGGNLIRTKEGLRLIDWDTVGLAPPERDLWMLDDLRMYSEITGREVDGAALDFYRLAWLVTDVAAFTAELRGTHTDNENAAHAMRALEITGGQLRSWL